MHSKGNHKQDEKTTLRMEENNCNWQRITLQNIQAVHAAQYQKNKQPNQKVGRKPRHFSKEDMKMANKEMKKMLNITHSLVQFSHSVVSDSLWPHELQHARPPCPPPTPGVHSNSCPSSWWCHPGNSASVVPFSSCPQSLPASVFSNESTLRMRWPKYWSFSFSIIPSKEHPGLISFMMDWLDLLAVQGTLKSLLQHHSSKASILRHPAFFTVQLSHPYMTTGKTIALTRRTFVGKVMSLLLNYLGWS